ncbi:hypothetical protein P3X46_026048 [Hevea brasiliensis]|uniref:Uncharacterized protein n=1 Tax=Hevea brasiliensis TaxID=3981 RepID=A0ABQ9KVR7_HEVBR|nr:hypothetical protein P3X46_026048 [Hevea brasiliensis]
MTQKKARLDHARILLSTEYQEHMNKLVAMDIDNVRYIIRATEEPCFELVKYFTLNKRVDTPSTSYNATGSSSHAEVEPSNREDDDVEVPNGDADVDNNADDFSQTFVALDQREQDAPDVEAVRDGVGNDADPPVTTLNPAIDDYDVGTIERIAVRDGVGNDADPPVTSLNPASDDYDVGTIERMACISY